MDTIFSLSSGQPPAGITLVRVSGPLALDSLRNLTGGEPLPVPRHLTLRRIFDPETGLQIDDPMITIFPQPNSYTGEDVVEYNLHGGRAILEKLLNLLSKQERHRQAEPGEFTKRAVLNGRLDLTQAEAVHDLIAAETEAQRAQALVQYSGALARLYDGWRETLLRSLAYVEAHLDFPDEALPDDLLAQIQPDLVKLGQHLETHLNDGHLGERLREGFHVVIAGVPNAGKSTLLNALSRREVAIVSPIAGTTRDVLEVPLNLGGYPVLLIDTAGLREDSADPIEMEGVRRARARLADADLRILLLDPTQPVSDQMEDADLTVWSKADLTTAPPGALSVSAQSGGGLDQLVNAITEHLKARTAKRSGIGPTRERHRAALGQVVFHVKQSLDARMPELLAEDLRLAARALGEITGRVHVDDLLDVIFRDFCIGK